MTMAGQRDALKTALAAVTNIKHAYDTAPESINELPAAYVMPTSGTYQDDFSGNARTMYEVVVLVQMGGTLAEAQDLLDGFLALTGTGSVLAALNDATLSTHGDYVKVRGWRDYGGLQYAGINYIGFKVDVEIGA